MGSSCICIPPEESLKEKMKKEGRWNFRRTGSNANASHPRNLHSLERKSRHKQGRLSLQEHRASGSGGAGRRKAGLGIEAGRSERQKGYTEMVWQEHEASGFDFSENEEKVEGGT